MQALSPTEPRWDAACSGISFDIKKWFVGVITPDFKNAEARMRCGSDLLMEKTDPSLVPVPRLEEATRTMRHASREFNEDGYAVLNAGTTPNARSFTSRWCSPLEAGSIRTCSSALAATSLGAGALALPYAFSLTGVGLGLATLTAAGLVASLSLQILMVAARYTGMKSYAAVLELAVGSTAASTALDLVVLMNGIGALVCILIFEGDFVPAIVAAPPGGLPGMQLGREAAIFAAALAAWPLTLSSNISALRYVAVLVPLVLLATVAIVLADTPSLSKAVRERGETVLWWHFEPRKWLQAVAIMVNAFANQMNAIPCANQLSKPSIARIVKATVNGNLLVWALLASLGLGGYLSWAAATQGDFLLNYPQGRPEIWSCRVMLALIVYLVLPVSCLPTAKSGAQLLFKSMGHSTAEVGPKAHAVSATVLLVCCMFVSLKVTNVAAVLGFLGGLLASSLMFWFPAAIFWLLLWPTQPRYVRSLVLLLLVLFGTFGWASVLVPYL